MEVDLLPLIRGRVTAAAGHGKTHLIAHTLHAQLEGLPALVLTHTNAGVRSLQQRLDAREVPRSRYRLETIDACMMQLVSCFPGQAGFRLDQSANEIPYDAIRAAAVRLVDSGALDRLLPVNYSRIMIDEYQDCLQAQHLFSLGLARTLRTVVLGDPLQAIFGFAGEVPDWDTDVGKAFDQHVVLGDPWRWKNAKNETLGRWIQDVRERILSGGPIRLDNSPACVRHHSCPAGQTGRSIRLTAARCSHRQANETLLVIGDTVNATARHTAMALT